ncbi:MAG: hypothetical protein DWQ01_10295 [Planctomycetota bacterium]|nr:MAG: hypothetical protein DWQ01_10295 [Planctomycetota bacterium]
MQRLMFRPPACLSLSLVLLACQSPTSVPLSPPVTVPESSDYQRTSSHQEVLAFLQAAAEADPRVVLQSFGSSEEGRDLPLVIVADPPVEGPEEARRRGLPVVLMQGNIHGGEVEGKEACLELLREVVWKPNKRQPYPVDQVVLLMAPIYNADGNDDFNSQYRRGQNGPAAPGRRSNASGLDLNRDWMKLESAEARAMVAFLNAWDPHVVVDLHATNGTAHAYALTYAPPLHPGTHADLLALLEQDWLPELRRRMRGKHGMETFDYGNFHRRDGAFEDQPQTQAVWRSFDYRPRFHNNYVGLRNRLAILSEAYAYADFRTRIRASKYFMTEILQLAAERGPELVAACLRFDQESERIFGAGQAAWPQQIQTVSRGEAETVLLRDVDVRVDPDSGRKEKFSTGPVKPVPADCQVKFAGQSQRLLPEAYFLSPQWSAVIQLLHRHGIRTETLDRPWRGPVEVHRVLRWNRARRPFQGHRMVQVEWQSSREVREFPAGTVKVSLQQPLARLAVALLDPQASDGLVVWNFWDQALERGEGAEFPVFGL